MPTPEEKQFEEVKATTQAAEAFESHPEDINDEDLKEMTDKNRSAKPNQEPLGKIDEDQSEEIQVVERSQSIVNIQINKKSTPEAGKEDGATPLEHVGTPEQSSPPKLDRAEEEVEHEGSPEAKVTTGKQADAPE